MPRPSPDDAALSRQVPCHSPKCVLVHVGEGGRSINEMYCNAVSLKVTRTFLFRYLGTRPEAWGKYLNITPIHFQCSGLWPYVLPYLQVMCHPTSRIHILWSRLAGYYRKRQCSPYMNMQSSWFNEPCSLILRPFNPSICCLHTVSSHAQLGVL